MSGLLSDLLSRRLLIVSGKGGTGKSSISAALALLAIRSGIPAAAVELGSESQLPRLLVAPLPADAGLPRSEPQALGSGVHHLRIVPEFALREYLQKQLRSERAARAIVGQPGIRRLLDAAPGWRDLIALGKLWHLTTRELDGRARWPLFIVDAPATGHGLSLLSGPAAVTELVRAGPLRRHVDAVLSLLRDQRRTLLLPVALAEELPVNEVLELREGVSRQGVALGPVIANAVEPSAPANTAALLAALEGLSGSPDALLDPRALRAVLLERRARRALQAQQLERLERATGEPPLELPYLASGIDGPAGSGALAAALELAAAQREAVR
jgi:anion-transporting  ArsA/GET3 family ATPase